MWTTIINFFRRLLAGTHFPVQNLAMDPLTQLYYVPIDAEGNEQEPLLISLKPDGAADISHLPSDLQSSLMDFGIPNELRTKTLYPKDGSSFLDALLAGQNPYMRFRNVR